MDEVHNLLRYLLAIAHLRGFLYRWWSAVCGGRRVHLEVWFFSARSLTDGLCLTEVKQQQVLIPLCLCDCQR